MRRDSKKLARLLVVALTAVHARFGWPASLALALVIAAGVWWLGPRVSPAFDAPPPNAERRSEPRGEQAPASRSPSGDRVEAVSPDDLQGVLTEVGRRVYESPAGVRYTPGSQQGHRLAHVMAHCRDNPDRGGQHGVFDTQDAAEVVLLVDEAYERAQSGRDTRTRKSDGRTTHTVNLRRRVGYVGGQSGKRRGYPPATHVRVVLEGDRLITAYPVVP